MIKVKVTVAEIENQFLLNNLSLLGPIHTKFSICVVYIKRRFGISARMSVNKVKVTVA